jgi:hypothetical protein
MTLSPFVLQVNTGPLLPVIVAAAALYAVFLLVPVFGLAVLFDVYRTNRRIADSMEAVEAHLETLGDNVAAVESTLEAPESAATPELDADSRDTVDGVDPGAEDDGDAESGAEEATESDTSEGGTTASAGGEAETDSSGGEPANGSDSDEADDAGESTE